MILDILPPDTHLVTLEETLNKVGWPDPVKLTTLKKNKLTIVDLTQEPHDAEYVEWLHECLLECHLKFILLSPNPEDHLVNDRTVFYAPDQANYIEKYLPDLKQCIDTLS
jgi:hypothetical protein